MCAEYVFFLFSNRPLLNFCMLCSTVHHMKTTFACRFSSSRFLHARLRTATLRSDFEGQAVLLNLLLRNYLSSNLFEQADKLVSKSSFPDTATNNEWARFLYYLGKCRVGSPTTGPTLCTTWVELTDQQQMGLLSVLLG